MSKRLFLSKKDAIKVLQDAINQINTMPENTFVMLTMDLDTDTMSDCGRRVPLNEGEYIINSSESRIYYGNHYMSQLELYSVRQDIQSQRRGVMRTILLPGKMN